MPFKTCVLGILLFACAPSRASRQFAIPMSLFEGRFYNDTGEAMTYMCNFINLSPTSRQTLTITYLNGTGSVDSTPRTHAEARSLKHRILILMVG